MKDIKTRVKPPHKKMDLEDSTDDMKHLENDEATIDLPDVKDIPGQEHIHVPQFREYMDSTVSSADEEGEGIWDDEKKEKNSSDVTSLEKEMLDMSANDMPTKDELQLRRATLDDRDDDGELLNERTSASAISGSDLDIPGADDDNENEKIGEEDEENNPYSLGGDEKSVNEERSGT